MKRNILDRARARIQGNPPSSRAARPAPSNAGISTEPSGLLIPEWPVLSDSAYHGVAGKIVRALEPHTEADPVGVLIQLLAAVGNIVGRGPRFRVEGNDHHANLYVCLVGESAKARKGTSWGRVKRLIGSVHPEWLDDCTVTGLSTGEGLISLVEDPKEKEFDVTGIPKFKEKRVFVAESEFAGVLRVMRRDGNTLSPILRQAWDGDDLHTLTRANPLHAKDVHLSFAGHITLPELIGLLRDVELFNGFANRFLWACVRRTKLLPEGGGVAPTDALLEPLRDAINRACVIGEMQRTSGARRLWAKEYARLTADQPGLYGAVTARAEAQTLRMSMIYALLDGTPNIDERHLQAALAVWDYCDHSARFIFGRSPENTATEKVRKALRDASPEALTKTDIHKATGKNLSADKLHEALAYLVGHQEAESIPQDAKSTSPERWRWRKA